MKKDKKNSLKGPSQRQMRVAESIKRSLGQLFIRGDIVLSFNTALISVTEVNLSPDFRNSTVFVRPLTEEMGNPTALIKELNQNKSQIRYLLAQVMELQFATDLHFVYDTSLLHAFKIDALLRQTRQEVCQNEVQGAL